MKDSIVKETLQNAFGLQKTTRMYLQNFWDNVSRIKYTI